MMVLSVLEAKDVKFCLHQWIVSRSYNWFPEGFKDLVTLYFKSLGFYRTQPVRTAILDVGSMFVAVLDPMVQFDCPRISDLAINP